MIRRENHRVGQQHPPAAKSPARNAPFSWLLPSGFWLLENDFIDPRVEPNINARNVGVQFSEMAIRKAHKVSVRMRQHRILEYLDGVFRRHAASLFVQR